MKDAPVYKDSMAVLSWLPRQYTPATFHAMQGSLLCVLHMAIGPVPGVHGHLCGLRLCHRLEAVHKEQLRHSGRDFPVLSILSGISDAMNLLARQSSLALLQWSGTCSTAVMCMCQGSFVSAGLEGSLSDVPDAIHATSSLGSRVLGHT